MRIKNTLFLLLFYTIYWGYAQQSPLQANDSLAQLQWVEEMYGKMDLKEKIGQLFMVLVASDQDKASTDKVKELITQKHIGGIIFSTGGPVRQAELTNEYQRLSKVPLLIGMDAEWGLAMRLDSTFAYPWNMTLGAIRDSGVVERIGYRIGSHAKRLGVHINFAPDVDININPLNPIIGNRSYGEDRENVAEKGAAFVRGMNRAGVLTSAKHFPGHGDTATDSHLDLPVLQKTQNELLSEELVPFKTLIDNGVDAIMVGHIALPALTGGRNIPASVSKEIITNLLRKKLHFDGAVVSDALNMHSVSKAFSKKGDLEWTAFEAGTDILCFAEHVREGLEKILSKADEKRIEKSFERVWKLKEKSIGSEEEIPKTLSLPTPFNKVVARNALTLFHGREEEIRTFREGGFFSVLIGKHGRGEFHRTIGLDKSSYTSVERKTSFEELKKEIGNHKRVLLPIFLPKAKPQDIFGLGMEKLKIVNQLLQNYEVIVYLFGNPYFLSHLPWEKAGAVVIAYQDLEGFEEVAGEHFLGYFKATGTLPVSL